MLSHARVPSSVLLVSLITSLLALAAGVPRPAGAQSRDPISTLETDQPLPYADGTMVLEYLRGLLSDAPIDNVLQQCPERLGVIAHSSQGSEWFCEHVANPPGFPGGGTSHLRFMETESEIFAVAAVPDVVAGVHEPERTERIYRQLLQEIGRLCDCQGAVNGVSYCHCSDLEVRLLMKGRRLALLAIDDLERYLAFQEAEREEPQSRSHGAVPGTTP